jgi:hypothetical protein
MAPPTASVQSDAQLAAAQPSARLAARLKEWTGYIPEVRLGKAIYRWAKKQPPPDDTERARPELPESR